MSVVHAIDFGTSTSSIMIGRPDGSVVKIRDPGSPWGAYSVRSVVSVRPDGSVAVGELAHRDRFGRPYRTEFKRDFGDPTAFRLGERSLRPDELAGQVIAFLRAAALRQVPDEPELVVCTVPASWERGYRDLMQRTAEAAGYRPGSVRTVSEPEAAAACVPAGPPGSLALVYDLGGGTFDVAVARAEPDGYRVLGAPGGLPDVGGGALDAAVLRHLRTRFPEQFAALFDSASPADPDTLRRRIELRERCEQLKVTLSVDEVRHEQLSELRPPVELRLTRAEFADLAGPLLDETLDECERRMSALRQDWPDIDRIVPVGGSSRMPVVLDALRKRSGGPVVPVDDPDLTVVHGAVLVAAAWAWPPPPTAPPRPPPTPPAPRRRFDPDRDLFDED